MPSETVINEDGSISGIHQEQRGSVPALIALYISVISFILWAIYVPFTFHEIVSLACLVAVLPVCFVLIVISFILSLVSLRLGAGKRRDKAIIALVLSIVQVLIWIGWVIFGTMWNTGMLE
ncbi:MAG: hypothetical protein JXA22_10855 [Candidatus Thermoplasmatota archaeon]|nr:hypothetical protein [Candidatus Thermoplasmatota archaeon]